jgi:hypothetical protein
MQMVDGILEQLVPCRQAILPGYTIRVSSKGGGGAVLRLSKSFPQELRVCSFFLLFPVINYRLQNFCQSL